MSSRPADWWIAPGWRPSHGQGKINGKKESAEERRSSESFPLQCRQRGKLDHILGHSSEERLLHSCAACGPIIVVPVHWRSGDQVICPKCLGNYDVHPDGGDFEVEWDTTLNPTWVPQPDTDTIEEITQYAPYELRLPANFFETSLSLV